MTRQINTEFVNPPIPVRTQDWQATFDGYEAGDLIGTGQTEQAAIDDLLEQAELDADELTGTNKQFGVGA